MALLENTLHDLIPQTDCVPITDRREEPMQIARDWHASVTIDHDRGRRLVGDGVTESNVAGWTSLISFSRATRN